MLGYVAIRVLHLHAPSPPRNEWAIHVAALAYLIPGVFLLTALGSYMAWGATTSASSRALAMVAVGAGFVVALVETLEDIPRSHAPWLAFLLPVFVVIVTFVPLKIMAASPKQSAAMSNQRLERP